MKTIQAIALEPLLYRICSFALLCVLFVSCGKKISMEGDASDILSTPSSNPTSPNLANDTSEGQSKDESTDITETATEEVIPDPVFTFKSLKINNGASYTFDGDTVQLTIDADAATSMYVTNTPGCLSGGSWEDYTAAKSWQLALSKFQTSVYIKFKDKDGSESECYNSSINLYLSQKLSSSPYSLGTCFRNDYGENKCWGYNSYGKLGLGDAQHRGDGPGEMGANLPKGDFGAGLELISYDEGIFHVCGIFKDKSLKCYGSNYYGKLGLGDTEIRGDAPGEVGDNLPTINLGTDKTAVQVVAGGNVTCALLNDGNVKCWGHNNVGQLGLGDLESRGDNPNEMGDNLPIVNLGTGKTAVQITSAGFVDTVCALLNDGNVKCWGRNDFGQLGYGDLEDRGDDPNEMGDNLANIDLGTGRTAKKILSGGSNVCALLDNDTVKCWGQNTKGQLGLGDINNRGDNPNEMGDNLPSINFGSGKTVKDLFVNDAHSCVILTSDEVKCWGKNDYGQLGLGDVNNRGDDPNEMGDNLPAVDLGTGIIAKELSVGGYHSCAYLSDESVKCWGRNDFGQLGLEDKVSRGDNIDEMGDFLWTIQIF